MSMEYKQNFEVFNARFLKVHSIAFYIELSSNYNEPLLLRTTFSEPKFLTKMLESNILYYNLHIDIISV